MILSIMCTPFERFEVMLVTTGASLEGVINKVCGIREMLAISLDNLGRSFYSALDLG